MHLSPGTAKRVFNSRRVGYSDSVECPEYLSPRWSSESQIDRELGSIPLRVGEKARFITAAEEVDMVDNMAKEDVKMLKQLVDSLEECVKSKDAAQYHEACKLIGVTKFGSGGEEAAVLRRMAL